MSRRLIAIVLHGGGRYYIDRLLAAGRIPHVASLLARGTSRSLLVPHPVSAAAWVTMMTGEDVGTHGVLDCMSVDARRYHAAAAVRETSHSYRDRTIFSVLSAHGRRVASLYLPMTWPPWPVNGVMVSGFPMPDERRPPAWPPEFAARLEPLAPARIMRFKYGDSAGLDAYLRTHTEKIAQLTLSVLRDPSFDAVFACLAAPDLAHHHFWRPDDEAAVERVLRVYEYVDAAIGELDAAAGPDDLVTLFSDHGGRPAPGRAFAVNRWLEQQGWLLPRATAGDPVVARANALVHWARRHRLNQRLGHLLPRAVRHRLSAVVQNDAFVDWSGTRAYGMNFFYPLCGVTVNLRGRQAHGIVAPGPEADTLVSEIVEALRALIDPETGRRVCRAVARAEEWFGGPARSRFPDVVAELHEDYDARPQLLRDVFGPNTLQWEYPYLGYHDREGFFVARGPGVRPGVIAEPIGMNAIPPTLLAAAGVPPPPWMQAPRFAL